MGRYDMIWNICMGPEGSWWIGGSLL